MGYMRFPSSRTGPREMGRRKFSRKTRGSMMAWEIPLSASSRARMSGADVGGVVVVSMVCPLVEKTMRVGCARRAASAMAWAVAIWTSRGPMGMWTKMPSSPV
ncbi:hypothetical protein RU01_21640 [Rhodococcus sp. MEB064]|nr:hypothetical protein RU01_21640 [Rhodococcus sp. MEB064]